jgi:hypothetical protein
MPIATTPDGGAGTPLTLPHLYHPFVTPVHPLADDAERQTMAWLNKHGLIEDPRWADGIRDGQIGEYCARVYSSATPDGLCIVTCAYAWIFCIDDGLCSLHGLAHSPGELGAVYLWLYEMIADPLGYDPVPLREALTARLHGMADFLLALQSAARDLCGRIASMSTRAQHARWVAGMMTFLFSTLWEAGRYAVSVQPGVAEYLAGRTLNGGGEAAFALIDIVADYEVPDAIYHDVEVQRLRKLCGLILCLCNDIFSYPKEAHESSRNLIGVLMQARGLTQQAALDEAVDIHNRYIEHYLALEEVVRGRIDFTMATRLLNDARSYIRGNYDWHFGSPRYKAARYYDYSRALRPGTASPSR